MQFPILAPTPQTRLVTDRFTGYDHRLRIADGAFYDTKNLSLRDFPLLSTRPRRGTVRTLTNPGGLLGKDSLVAVENGVLTVNGLATPLTGLTPGRKQLVSMGACVLVFPDKRYYNTADPSDYGSLEADLSVSGEIAYCLCGPDGTALDDPISSAEEPRSPANGQLWLDLSGGGRSLRQYSASQGLWLEPEGVFTRVTLPSLGQVPALFRQYDGVTVSGAAAAELNGEKILYALGGGETRQDYVVLAGIVDAAFTGSGTLRLRRTLPQMDYVCEAGNRLWGCRYGNDGGRNVNEIYASALGDFKNFRQFLGLSTDSWAASVGSDGPWTGAVNYLGRPCFFKEERIHQVTISSAGAHRLDETPCRGVQRGCAGSLCVVGESLYYKSPEGVCVWQGGFPQSVGAVFGGETYHAAVAGTAEGRLYLSMLDGEEHAHLFVLDTALGLWIREDELRVTDFAAVGGELYALEADTGRLLALLGTAGEPEESLPWAAETGLLRYRSAARKYLSRTNLSLRMAPGASLRLKLRYDSAGPWEDAGSLSFSGTGTVTVPVRPRRCDHLQLRLEGEGEMTLFALTRVLELGSDG